MADEMEKKGQQGGQFGQDQQSGQSGNRGRIEGRTSKVVSPASNSRKRAVRVRPTTKKRTRTATVNAARPSFFEAVRKCSTGCLLESPGLLGGILFCPGKVQSGTLKTTPKTMIAGCSSYCDLGLVTSFRRRLDLDYVVLYGIDDQIANGVQAELPHYVAAMRFHGLCAQA